MSLGRLFLPHLSCIIYPVAQLLLYIYIYIPGKCYRKTCPRFFSVIPQDLALLRSQKRSQSPQNLMLFASQPTPRNPIHFFLHDSKTRLDLMENGLDTFLFSLLLLFFQLDGCKIAVIFSRDPLFI